MMWGSRGSEESMRTGAEGPDSGSLIFSRMNRSWFVRDAEGIANLEMKI
jgi:hypothetical protein